ncbi:MAG TPA: hypothetical protein VN688_13490 [Gemmataceae bacterium]|nr:hypothetical protein [Gemmataceae bacterium]
MLTEEAIRHALHANRVIPLSVANPHGPLGLKQLVASAPANLTPQSSNKTYSMRLPEWDTNT